MLEHGNHRPGTPRQLAFAGASSAFQRRPEAASKSTAAAEYWSDRSVAGSPRSCSGAMYSRVPTRIPSSVSSRWSLEASRAMPKSPRTARCSDEEDVLRLHVAVNDPGRVRGGECLHQVAREPQHLVDGQRAGGEAVGEGLALEEVHHVVGKPVALIGPVDRDDVRMLQPCKDPGLAEEPFPRHRCGELGTEHLDGHRAVQSRVLRAVHDAHSPGGDPALHHELGCKGTPQPLQQWVVQDASTKKRSASVRRSVQGDGTMFSPQAGASSGRMRSDAAPREGGGAGGSERVSRRGGRAPGRPGGSGVRRERVPGHGAAGPRCRRRRVW